MTHDTTEDAAQDDLSLDGVMTLPTTSHNNPPNTTLLLTTTTIQKQITDGGG